MRKLLSAMLPLAIAAFASIWTSDAHATSCGLIVCNHSYGLVSTTKGATTSSWVDGNDQVSVYGYNSPGDMPVSRYTWRNRDNVLTATGNANGTGGVTGATGVYIITGGTCARQPRVSVTWSGAGAITGVTVVDGGDCSTLPSSTGASITYALGQASGWGGATVNFTHGASCAPPFPDDGGGCLNITGTGGGYLMLNKQTTYNPKQWGAYGDGKQFQLSVTYDGTTIKTSKPGPFLSTDANALFTLTDTLNSGATGPTFYGQLASSITDGQDANVATSPAVYPSGSANSGSPHTQYLSWGHDDTAAVQNMINYIGALEQITNNGNAFVEADCGGADGAWFVTTQPIMPTAGSILYHCPTMVLSPANFNTGRNPATMVTSAWPVSVGKTTGTKNATAVYHVKGTTGCSTVPTLNMSWDNSGNMSVSSIANPGVGCTALPSNPALLAYDSGTASGWTNPAVDLDIYGAIILSRANVIIEASDVNLGFLPVMGIVNEVNGNPTVDKVEVHSWFGRISQATVSSVSGTAGSYKLTGSAETFNAVETGMIARGNSNIPDGAVVDYVSPDRSWIRISQAVSTAITSGTVYFNFEPAGVFDAPSYQLHGIQSQISQFPGNDNIHNQDSDQYGFSMWERGQQSTCERCYLNGGVVGDFIDQTSNQVTVDQGSLYSGLASNATNPPAAVLVADGANHIIINSSVTTGQIVFDIETNDSNPRQLGVTTLQANSTSPSTGDEVQVRAGATGIKTDALYFGPYAWIMGSNGYVNFTGYGVCGTDFSYDHIGCDNAANVAALTTPDALLGGLGLSTFGFHSGIQPPISSGSGGVLSYSVLPSDKDIIFYGTAGVSLVLPAAASDPNREIDVTTQTAQTVISASANIKTLTGGGPGTSILSATAGKWAVLKSDGVNWRITQAN